MVPKQWLERKTLERLVVPAIVVLVGLSAFALGRLSAQVPLPAYPYEKTP